MQWRVKTLGATPIKTVIKTLKRKERERSKGGRKEGGEGESRAVIF